ncbi:MAG TPA: DegT/DnrJ/EryC1/StrS family aminotransferase, partial [Chloroflexota bacterium]|nr:DegT/DnrJ/EryC1/StrS family aminotransferase [Chloroflexota bacterium]
LGAYGEAGGVVTNEPDLAEKLQVLRDHGSPRRYYHEQVGINGRLDEVQAAVLCLKLPHLADGNQRRRENAARYSERLAHLPVTVPAPSGDDHVHHLYVIRSRDRDDLQAHLKEQGIGTGIHYPVPCHLQPACSQYGAGPGSLPVTERLVGEILSLPMFPELSEEQIDRVVEAVEVYCFSNRAATSVDAAG